ncbi:MAG: TerB N-terminal domain-containing protein [Oscillospiraceae bacterium]|nr:TerB N-terminal domain-containing protein [Oscillospiraceae bacterium]
MDSNRMKKAMEWFYSTVYRDAPIRSRPPEEKLPSLLRTARSLESGKVNARQSAEALFLKQAKLLANYEDDCPYDREVQRYYPTYAALSDRELRGYFTWRTKLRRGQMEKTSLSFAFLYIYELLHQVGVDSPMEGYEKLKDFQRAYGQIDPGICNYLDRWLRDYVIYYDLDPNLLAEHPQVLFDRSLAVLEHIREQSRDKVLYAVKQLAPKWLSRSKFYAAYSADCDGVIYGVLKKMWEHYNSRAKYGLVQQLFGKRGEYRVRLFDGAVFSDWQKNRNREYVLDECCVYRCRSGLWSVEKYAFLSGSGNKLEHILKTIDAVMRQEYAYKHPIKTENEAKWLLKLIHEEVQALLAEQKAAEAKKLRIDYSVLDQIRQEAAMTREKLTVEEEEEEAIPEPLPVVTPAQPSEELPLNEPELRLLRCLLYGGSLGWVQAEGQLLSVLVDGINEKLYDIFLDTVLLDTPEVIEDYMDELKEMVAQ